MRLPFVVFVALCIVVLVGAFFLVPEKSTNSGPIHAEVVLTENGFEPHDVTIARHGTITFSTTLDKPFWPASNLHPLHSLYSQFDPFRPIARNERWTFQFDRTGNWEFHDHLRSYFLGTIHVVE